MPTAATGGGPGASQPTWRYADGRLIKHPRAANFAGAVRTAKYLYWFHNHGGNWYEDRNPVWLCGGVEAETPEGKVIHWSQPEIVLYDDDPYVRMSYPDLIEEDGRYFLSETQKDIPRVHEVDRELVEGLWSQFEPPAACACTVRSWTYPRRRRGAWRHDAGTLPEFLGRDIGRPDQGTGDFRRGVSMGFQIRRPAAEGTLVLFDSRATELARCHSQGRPERRIRDACFPTAGRMHPGKRKTVSWNRTGAPCDPDPGRRTQRSSASWSMISYWTVDRNASLAGAGSARISAGSTGGVRPGSVRDSSGSGSMTGRSGYPRSSGNTAG